MGCSTMGKYQISYIFVLIFINQNVLIYHQLWLLFLSRFAMRCSKNAKCHYQFHLYLLLYRFNKMYINIISYSFCGFSFVIQIFTFVTVTSLPHLNVRVFDCTYHKTVKLSFTALRNLKFLASCSLSFFISGFHCFTRLSLGRYVDFFALLVPKLGTEDFFITLPRAIWRNIAIGHEIKPESRSFRFPENREPSAVR